MDIPEGIKKKIDEDIKCLKEAAADFNSVNTPEFAKAELCQNIGNFYDSIIPDFGNSLWGYYTDNHMYTQQSGDCLYDNLRIMKTKLEAFKACNYSSVLMQTKKGSSLIIDNRHTIQNSNTNQITFNISFEDARNTIEDMTGLTAPETDEILAKIDEIKAIVEAPESKKRKWDKIKPIVKWMADKSVDVGIVLLPLLLKLQQ